MCSCGCACALARAYARTLLRRFGLGELTERIEHSIAQARRQRGYRIVRSDAFQLSVCCVILLQSVFIGFGAQDALEVQAFGAPWVSHIV